MQRLLLFCAAVLVTLPDPCKACLWDSDTLMMERQRFPDANELIAGNFIRHSAAYYEWRISDRNAMPIAKRRPGDFDDIAVAYDKLGQHDKAVQTMDAKTARWPGEQRYETEANLGTFHIHAGRFEKGLVHLKNAIEINPDAHFGREVYQQLLVEYVIKQRLESDKLPLRAADELQSLGFTSFVLERQMPETGQELVEIKAAVKGILGMMRFGRFESPILLEVLGDLLMTNSYSDDSKMLAARAYLKASYAVDDSVASASYRTKAINALEMQFDITIEDIESQLKMEIEQGAEFFERISADEKAWAASGKNLDIEFAKKFHEAPTLPTNYTVANTNGVFLASIKWLGTGLVILTIGFALFVRSRLNPRRSENSHALT